MTDVAVKAPPRPVPGLYRDLSMEEYLALPAMSASRLERFRRSPLQYRHSLTEPGLTTRALERGTALHMALLEPDLFRTRYVVAGPCEALLASGKRKGEPCGNGGSSLHLDVGWLCGTHVKGFGPGLDDSAEILPADDYDSVLGMAEAVMAHPRARTLMEGRGEFEATVVFEDPETGVVCKIRPDRLVKRAGMYVALKSTRDAAPWAFPRDAENRGYFRSLAIYRRGLRAIGWPLREIAVLAVESAAPHDLECWLVDEGSLDKADVEISRLLGRYAICEADDYWPGYSDGGFRILRRPPWATDHDEEE